MVYFISEKDKQLESYRELNSSDQEAIQHMSRGFRLAS